MRYRAWAQSWSSAALAARSVLASNNKGPVGPPFREGKGQYLGEHRPAPPRPVRTPNSLSPDLHRLFPGPSQPQPVHPTKDLPTSTCFLMRVQGLPPQEGPEEGWSWLEEVVFG